MLKNLRCNSFLAAVFTAAILSFTVAAESPADTLEAAVRGHLDYLASDRMAGRGAGSAQAREAAEYILAQFQGIGLEARFQNLPFGGYRNVVATIPPAEGGSDYIVLGAHYDGIGTFLGPVNNAADDNASGVAALLEIGRMLASSRGPYGVILVAFDAEEIGLFGSKHFQTRFAADYPDSRIALMMSIDMVGQLRDEGRLTIEGTGTIKDGAEIIQAIATEGFGVHCRASSAATGVITDSFPFGQAGIPAFTVTTELASSEYHLPGDEISTLDIAGIARVASFVAELTQRLQGRIEATGLRINPTPPASLGLCATTGIASYDMENAPYQNYKAMTGLSVAAWLPLGYLDIMPIGIKTQLGYELLQNNAQGQDWLVHSLSLPLGVYIDGQIGTIRLLNYAGVYYRLALAGSSAGGTDYTAAFSRHDFGFNLGFELHFAGSIELFRHGGVGLDFRYGLLNLNTNPSGPEVRPVTIGLTLMHRL